MAMDNGNVADAKYGFWLLLLLTCLSVSLGRTPEEILKDPGTDPVDPAVPQFLGSKSTVRFDANRWIATLSCTFRGWPPPQVSWHYRGSKMAGEVQWRWNGSSCTSTLLVDDFRQEEEGRAPYTCLATNKLGFDDAAVWPEEAPILVADGVDTAMPSERITATCVAPSGSEVVWKLPGRRDDHQDVEYRLLDDGINRTNIVAFTAAETDCGAKYLCCVMSKNPRRATSPTCTELALMVKARPRLVDYRSCSSDDPHCRLSCSFLGCPIPQNISWTYCPQSQGECSTVDQPTVTTVQDAKVSSDLDLGVARLGFYTCQAEGSSRTFNVTETRRVTPKLTSNVTSVDRAEDGSVVAHFECNFRSNLWPAVRWFKEGISWSNGSEDIAGDGGKFRIEVNLTSPDTYRTTLRIVPYSDLDWNWYYYCEAHTAYGTFTSSPLVAYAVHESVTIEASRPDLIYEDGETVSVSCRSAGGFPPPRWFFRAVAEDDIAVESSYNTQSANVTFVASWTNCRVKLECTALNVLQPLDSPEASTEIFVDYYPAIVDVHNCSAEDFRINGTCDLRCTAQHSSVFTEKDHEWIYYTYESNDTFYLITENTSVSEVTPCRSTYSLSLQDYSAAYYMFHVQYYDPPDDFEDLEQVFQIDPSVSGVPLGGACEENSTCLAIHSLCSNGTCQCLDPYPYPIEMSPNASACVPAAEPGEHCYNNVQCEANFNCSDTHICECNTYYVHVAEINASDCVRSRVYGQFCIYNVQCALADDQSCCDEEEHVCVCMSGYQFTTFDYRCEPVSSGLSPGVIFGIVVAVIAIHILGYYMFRCYRNSLQRKQLQEMQNLCQTTDSTNYLTFRNDSEDPTFSSSSLRFQDQNLAETICLPRASSSRSSRVDDNDSEITKL